MLHTSLSVIKALLRHRIGYARAVLRDKLYTAMQSRIEHPCALPRICAPDYRHTSAGSSGEPVAAR